MLTRLAMAEPRIRRIVRRRQVDFRFPIKGHRLYLYGHNPLIRLGYRGSDRPEDRLHVRGRAAASSAWCAATAAPWGWCC